MTPEKLKEALERATDELIGPIASSLNHCATGANRTHMAVRSMLRYSHTLAEIAKLITATCGATRTEFAQATADFLVGDRCGLLSTVHADLFDDIIAEMKRGRFYTDYTRNYQESAAMPWSTRPLQLLTSEARTNAKTGMVALYFIYKLYDRCLKRYLYEACDMLNLKPDESPYFFENERSSDSADKVARGFVYEATHTVYDTESMYRVLRQAAECMRDVFGLEEASLDLVAAGAGGMNARSAAHA